MEPKPVATRKQYLQPLEREAGIEPAYLAWKANVLPLNYSRLAVPPLAPSRRADACGGPK